MWYKLWVEWNKTTFFCSRIYFFKYLASKGQQIIDININEQIVVWTCSNKSLPEASRMFVAFNNTKNAGLIELHAGKSTRVFYITYSHPHAVIDTHTPLLDWWIFQNNFCMTSWFSGQYTIDNTRICHLSFYKS